MTRLLFAAVLAAVPTLHLLAAQTAPAPRTAAPAPTRTQTPPPVAPAVAHETTFGPAEQTALVKQYCVTCHNDRAKAGQLTLASFDAAKATEHLEVTEKMIRKLRAGMMPRAGARRPDAAELDAHGAVLEGRAERAGAAHPNPGPRPIQRHNRP